MGAADEIGSSMVRSETLAKIKCYPDSSSMKIELGRLIRIKDQIADTVANLDRLGSLIGIDMKLRSLNSIVLARDGGTFCQANKITFSLSDMLRFGERPIVHEMAHHVQIQNQVDGNLDYVFNRAYVEAGSSLFSIAYHERGKRAEGLLKAGKKKLLGWFAASSANGLGKEYLLANGLALFACLIRPDINELAKIFVTTRKEDALGALASDFARLSEEGDTLRGVELKAHIDMIRKEMPRGGPARLATAAWLSDAEMFIRGPELDRLKQLESSMGLEKDVETISLSTRGALFRELAD